MEMELAKVNLGNWDQLFVGVVKKFDPNTGWTLSYYDIKSYENAKS